jgi:hypothetical protein
MISATAEIVCCANMRCTGGENASVRSGRQQTRNKGSCMLSGFGRRPAAATLRRRTNAAGRNTFALASDTTSVAKIGTAIGQLCPAILSR